MRLRLFQIVQRAQDNDQVSRWYDVFIVVVAFLSIVPLMFKEEDQSADFLVFLNIIDIVTVSILFSDYVFRWITHDIRTGNGLKSFIYYPFSPMAIIDLLSILPSITVLHNILKFLRVLRIVRILRMFKGLTIVTNVFIRERRTLISVVFFIFVYIFTVALIMFTVEPDTFGSFADALYWSTTALATIGYGDIYPVTELGKAIATVSSIVGIAVVAFPAGIVTGGYITQLHRAKEEGREYFALPVKHNKPFKGSSITKYKSLKTYFKTHRKVKVYLIVIMLGVLFAILLGFITFNIFSVCSFGLVAFVIVALLLEPCAGIFTALIFYFLLVCFSGYGGEILELGVASLYCVSFGVLFRRGREVSYRSFMITLFLCVIVSSVYSFFVANIVEPQASNELIFSIDSVMFINNYLNTSFEASLFAYFLITRLIFSILILIFTFFCRKYVWGSKLDPVNYFAKSKRYRYRIYKRKKNELSYLQAWAESNPDENEDLDDIDLLVKKGKRSIELSKKSIENKKKKVIKMQQNVDKNLSEIEKLKREISQHEAAISVKKKVVKKVKKKVEKLPDDQTVSLEDILPDNIQSTSAAEFSIDHEALNISPKSNIPTPLKTVFKDNKEKTSNKDENKSK